jgi:cysteine desulfurase/selenocysteine lyase
MLEAAATLETPAMLDIRAIRQQFPILSREVNGQPLVYLDSAASSQKPLAVIEGQREYLAHHHANIHRSAHHLAARATRDFEGAREKIGLHLGAAHSKEIIFTSGTTDAINLVAQTWGRVNLDAGDVVLVPRDAHHAALVPWQMIAENCDAIVEPIEIELQGERAGQIDRAAFTRQLQDLKPKLVVLGHVSNALGTIHPVEELCLEARNAGATTLVDGAQALPHLPIDVQKIGCDFYAVSAHKAYGPTGIGALYGRADVLDAMPPWRGGGEMIKSVSFEGTTFGELPFKFEAGTPHISGAIGFGLALDWLNEIGLQNAQTHEEALTSRATKQLLQIDGLRILGPATGTQKASVISFVIQPENAPAIHPADLATLLDNQGIAARTGHHCTEPLMAALGLAETGGTIRISFAVYNSFEEVDRAIEALKRAVNMLL